MSDLKLAAEFPAATRQDWLKLVESALKGAPFEKKLVSKTYDDISIQPLYERAKDAKRVAGRPDGEPWGVVQRVDIRDPKEANKQALRDLENGATGLKLVLPGSPGDYGFALPASKEALAQALDEVWLDAAEIELDVGPLAKDAPLWLAEIAKERGIDPAKANFRFGLDPLGAIALHGKSSAPWKELAPQFASTVNDLTKHGFKKSLAATDGRIMHASGGSEAQELAYVLACGVEYMRALEAGGSPLNDARQALFFRLAADSDQFLTIAKFRALRKLWARVEEAAALQPQPIFISAETAWRMITKRDPNVNMLRTTMAVAAASFGGANSITALPHTIALGLPDGFARRVARNTQTVLLEESNLFRVGDPAAGSGGIEALTAELCETAWKLFQEIEAAGGLAAALQSGLLQKNVAETRAARERNIAIRKDAITGTSEFPNVNENKEAVLDDKPGAPLIPFPEVSQPLSRMRLAEPFEALRDAADAMKERPKVFLANLGKAADFTARTTFARNFFEAGGIAAVPGEGLTSPEDAVKAFKASGAKLACICSSDEVYDAQAEAVAKALKNAGASVWLAGRASDKEAAYKAAGIGGFVYTGCDVIAALKEAHAKL
ncbi:MAG: methylmalonyl-CoA mutase small subunit [Xanthobacteraceae bacterium]|nr:methylmalonyl-CoA mutase small subunit [Xanthobacteraceae bacterium]MCW5674095.1 methylmalonyl-CoA mutase small subunit [Xanthobacteraceae bacterium]